MADLKSIGSSEVLWNVFQTKHPEYFTSTLCIFVCRLYLRYCALSYLQQKDDILLDKPGDEPLPSSKLDISKILEAQDNFKEVIPLLLLLLLHAFKGLVQDNRKKFSWYNHDSTIMKYLFIVIKDIYQFPTKSYNISNFSLLTRKTIEQDLKVIIGTNCTIYKLVLVEDLIKLIELKLASLWSKEELYKILFVKSIHEHVWSVNKKFIVDSKNEMNKLRDFSIFAADYLQIESNNNLDFQIL